MKNPTFDLHNYSLLFWGLLAIGFASVASQLDNLVEFVNILGLSFLRYGSGGFSGCAVS